MRDIFTEQNIYPHEGRIKDHFKDIYQSVYVALLPFFQVDRLTNEAGNFTKSKQISVEEAKKEIDFLRNIPLLNAEIFRYNNDEYPTDEEIYKSGKRVSWKSVIIGTGLKDSSELNKALKVSIGALRKVFFDPQLTEKLNNYTNTEHIWHPTEGGFDILSKIAIYQTFKRLNKSRIIVTDEFYETSKILDIDKLTDLEFSEKIGYKDYYLYPEDKEILFTIEYDSFFFLIATDEQKMQMILEEKYFEGFLCDERTEHSW